MGTIKAYLDLCRVSNLPTVWTNVLAASLLAGGRFEAASFLLLALALSCFYLAGMSFNDICDLAHDRQRRPARPIPSGRVTVRGAWALTVTLFAGGLLLLGLAPKPGGVGAGLLLLAAILAYDLRHKGNPWSVLLMASCRFLVFVVVAIALIGDITLPLLVAGGAQFVYVVVISLVARHENASATPFAFPVVPAMLAGISLLDGVVMAIFVSPLWLAAGAAGTLLTWAAQRFVRGD